MKKKRRTIAAPGTSLSLEGLRDLAKNKSGAKENPDGLLMKEIRLAPSVFQWRQEGTDLLARDQLVDDCVVFLEQHRGNKPLEPLLVYGAGDMFFLVDGHHRWEAYKRNKWKQRVPVEYFRGTLKEARAEAIARNSASKLRITDADKLESAWRLLLNTAGGVEDWTWSEIIRLTGASRKTVHRMSQCLKRYGSRASELPWMRARKLAYEEQISDELDKDREDWKVRRIKRIAEYLKKGPSLTQDPEFTAAALEAISPMLPKALSGEWLEHALQQFMEIVRIDLPEKADALEDVLNAWQLAYFYGGLDEDKGSDDEEPTACL